MISDYRKDSEILKALGHPIRLRMVEGLITHECNVSKIVKVLKIPQSTASQHLAVLSRQGIIVQRKDGVKTCYCVKDRRIIELVRVLENDKNRGRTKCTG